MPPIDFGSSSDGEGQADWEIAVKAKKDEKERKEREEKEAAAARELELLRKRKREEGSAPKLDLTPEEKARLDAKKREVENVRAAQKMLQDSSDDDDKAPAKAAPAAKGGDRDYTLEDDFMAGKAAPGAKKPPIEEMPAQTVEDFDRLAMAIGDKLKACHKRAGRNSNDALYIDCLKKIMRHAVEPLFWEDVKELSDHAAMLSAEKHRRERDKDPKKKAASGKPQLNVGSGAHKFAAADDDFI